MFFDPTRPLISEEKFYKETNATNSAIMPRGSLITADPFLSNVVCKLIDFDTVTDIGTPNHYPKTMIANRPPEQLLCTLTRTENRGNNNKMNRFSFFFITINNNKKFKNRSFL